MEWTIFTNCWQLEDKISLCTFIKKRIIKDGEMRGMKSHDYHVMMQEILPLCMQHLTTKGCNMAIIRLFCVFKKLCAKIVDPTTMGDFKQDVALTLVLLECEFPSSFLMS